MLREKLGRTVSIPDDPQQIGALGAALLAMESG
jgi:activator of 2-hydroxyglutaryl-CoA dehydratase